MVDYYCGLTFKKQAHVHTKKLMFSTLESVYYLWSNEYFLRT